MEKQNITEIKIQVPEGMCIDEKNSTFECIKFKPKELTYDDIAKELFLHKRTYCINIGGNISNFISVNELLTKSNNNSVSKKQCERLLAINQLMNVAYYFNEIVDKNVDSIGRFIPTISTHETVGIALVDFDYKNSLVWFKTEKSLKKAIKILGEETVKLAVSL